MQPKDEEKINLDQELQKMNYEQRREGFSVSVVQAKGNWHRKQEAVSCGAGEQC